MYKILSRLGQVCGLNYLKNNGTGWKTRDFFWKFSRKSFSYYIFRDTCRKYFSVATTWNKASYLHFSPKMMDLRLLWFYSYFSSPLSARKNLSFPTAKRALFLSNAPSQVQLRPKVLLWLLQSIVPPPFLFFPPPLSPGFYRDNDNNEMLARFVVFSASCRPSNYVLFLAVFFCSFFCLQLLERQSSPQQRIKVCRGMALSERKKNTNYNLYFKQQLVTLVR